MIDLHAHILPGLDDGPERIEEAVRMCRIAYGDGVRAIVATPHMNDGVYNVSPARAREAAAALREALDREGIGIDLLPGGDVALSMDALEKLEAGEALTVCDAGKYVMLELPSDVLPAKVHDAIFAIQSAGYATIISHIERNLAVQKNIELARELAERGSLMQITAASIVGEFGRSAAECAAELIERRIGHLVATDMHRERKRPPGRMTPARMAVSRMLSDEETREIFDERPKAIIAGEFFVVPEPEAAEKQSWWKRWMS